MNELEEVEGTSSTMQVVKGHQLNKPASKMAAPKELDS